MTDLAVQPDNPALTSGDVVHALVQGIASNPSLTTRRAKNFDDWEQVLVSLIKWRQVPASVDEDGLISPTVQAISAASAIVRFLRENGMATPTHVVCDGDGGITLHRRGAEVHDEIRVRQDGTAEFLRFRGAELETRQPLRMA
jgi:hypothetical protein